jgi:tetratricopeptide (TPR) repeat protein
MKPLIIIAGAGISKDAPTNLPNWWEFNSTIVESIKKTALKQCPSAEGIIDLIDINALPVQSISDIIFRQAAGNSYFGILRFLEGVAPNANHFAISELAKRREIKAVITTNFDTMIEKAFRVNAIPLICPLSESDYYNSLEENHCKIYKIHGSVVNEETLIDTVTQKALGISAEKRLLLELECREADIAVIGFSGADLDFDIDYIPFSSAVKNNCAITWVVHPGSRKSDNLIKLHELYGNSFNVKEMSLSDYFVSLGIDYQHLQIISSDTALSNSIERKSNSLETEILNLLESPHIGTHGCVGYCFTFLHALCLNEEAKKLADIYSESFDENRIDVFSVLGIFPLAMQYHRTGNFDKSLKYYNIALLCHKKMQEFNKDNEAAMLETSTNCAAILNNIANIHLNNGDVDKAIEYLEQIIPYAEKTNNYNLLAVSSFNTAQAKYEKDSNYDQYIQQLRIADCYAKRAGDLTCRVEILLEEVSLRMHIGEYYCAKIILDDLNNIIINVANRTFNYLVDCCNLEYNIRVNNQDEIKNLINKISKYDIKSVISMRNISNTLALAIDEIEQSETGDSLLESIITGFVHSLEDDPIRASIVYYEYHHKKEYIAALLQKVCIEYTKNNEWLRLYDIAQCYHATSLNENDSSVALYYMGVSKLETADYTEAINYFESVTKISNGSRLYISWAYLELAKLYIQERNIMYSFAMYEKFKELYPNSTSLEDYEGALFGYAVRLRELGYYNDSSKVANSILDENPETPYCGNLRLLISYNEKSINTVSIRSNLISPQDKANEALALHHNNKYAEAWQLIHEAKNDYLTNNDVEGAGKCENNMGGFCMTENRSNEATVHYKNALQLKKQMHDDNGVVWQWAILLQLFINNDKEAEALNLVKEIETNLIKYGNCNSIYILYYALFKFYKWQYQIANALEYAKKAYEGIQFVEKAEISNGDEQEYFMNKLKSFIDIFDYKKTDITLPINEEQSNNIGRFIAEAARLSNMGQFAKCYKILDEIELDGLDAFTYGQIAGTYANAYLREGKHELAIAKYDEAIMLMKQSEFADKALQNSMIINAIHGQATALDKLSQVDDAIELLKSSLSLQMTYDDKCRMIQSLSNRVMRKHEFNLSDNKNEFDYLLGILSEFSDSDKISYQNKGAVQSSIANLFLCIDDKTEALKHLELAKDCFVFTNSEYLEPICDEIERVKLEINKDATHSKNPT